MFQFIDKTWLWDNKKHLLMMFFLLCPAFFFFGIFSIIALLLYYLALWRWNKIFSNILTQLFYASFSALLVSIFLGTLFGTINYFFEEPRIILSKPYLSETSLHPEYRLYGRHGPCIVYWKEMTLTSFVIGKDFGAKIGSTISPGIHNTYQGPYPNMKQSLDILKAGLIYKSDNYIQNKNSLPFEMEETTFKAIMSDQWPSSHDQLVGYIPSEVYYPKEFKFEGLHAVKWAECGPNCLVVRPVTWFGDGNYVLEKSILLVDTETSVVFARYEHHSELVFRNGSASTSNRTTR